MWLPLEPSDLSQERKDEARKVAAVIDMPRDSRIPRRFDVVAGRANIEGSLADDRPHALEEVVGLGLPRRIIDPMTGRKSIDMGPFGREALLHRRV
jgi:hypothetical protein